MATHPYFACQIDFLSLKPFLIVILSNAMLICIYYIECTFCIVIFEYLFKFNCWFIIDVSMNIT